MSFKTWTNNCRGQLSMKTIDISYESRPPCPSSKKARLVTITNLSHSRTLSTFRQGNSSSFFTLFICDRYCHRQHLFALSAFFVLQKRQKIKSVYYTLYSRQGAREEEGEEKDRSLRTLCVHWVQMMTMPVLVFCRRPWTLRRMRTQETRPSFWRWKIYWVVSKQSVCRSAFTVLIVHCIHRFLLESKTFPFQNSDLQLFFFFLLRQRKRKKYYGLYSPKNDSFPRQTRWISRDIDPMKCIEFILCMPRTHA